MPPQELDAYLKRRIGDAATVLKQLAHRVATRLPANVETKARARILKAVKSVAATSIRELRLVVK